MDDISLNKMLKSTPEPQSLLISFGAHVLLGVK